MRALVFLAAAFLSTAAPAATPWFEARSSHFIVYSPGSEASVRDFATRLERFDKGMRVFRNLPDRPTDRSNPLLVYVVPGPGAVERLCRSGGGDKDGCRNVAGFYVPRTGGSLVFTPHHSGDGGKFDMSAQTVLFHEYAHHFMFANYTAAYPGWFTEGFAEFNSTARFDRDGTIGFGIPALHRAYGLVNGKPLSLEALLTADNRKLDDMQREALYGRGWLLTHYLTFSPNRHGQLSDYLTALNDGKPSLDAARGAFGDLKKLDHDLDSYLMARRMSYLPLKPDRLPIGPVALRPMRAGEIAMMPVRWRSQRGVDAATAAVVVADARRLAAPFPDDPDVQTGLAEAEDDAGHDALAEAAVDRALAADPKNRAALMYKGRIHLHRAVVAQAGDPAVWAEARSWFVKANRLDPDDAEPLLLFYQSFGAAHREPTANAVTGLMQAFDLAPQGVGARYSVAREYLRDGKLKEARLVLAPLAFDPHAGPDNPASKLIALIDRGDPGAIREYFADREKAGS